MDSDWRPLSQRRGIAEPEELLEGIPGHLRYPVGEWLRGQFGWFSTNGMNNQLMNTIASSLRIEVSRNPGPGGISDQLFAELLRDEDKYLDCLDLTLHLKRGNDANSLRDTLRVGGSAWTVASSGKELERRVDAATETAFAEAVGPGDEVATELQEAWSAIFGRNPNPSDAWDHAIKAVEDLLLPVVIPGVVKGNLGGVAGELKANPHKWTFGMPGNAGRHNAETLEGLLRHIWPNPDRHGGGTKRAPTAAEAEGVVRIAVLIVGLCRNRLVKVV